MMRLGPPPLAVTEKGWPFGRLSPVTAARAIGIAATSWLTSLRIGTTMPRESRLGTARIHRK